MALDHLDRKADPRADDSRPPRSNVSWWQRALAVVLLIVFLGGVLALVIL